MKPAPLRLACLGFLALAFTGASPLAADTPECAGPGETRFRILLREFSGPDADLDARQVPDGRVAQIREAAGRPLSQSGSVPDGARIFVSEKLGAGDEARALRAIRSVPGVLYAEVIDPGTTACSASGSVLSEQPARGQEEASGIAVRMQDHALRRAAEAGTPPNATLTEAIEARAGLSLRYLRSSFSGYWFFDFDEPLSGQEADAIARSVGTLPGVSQAETVRSVRPRAVGDDRLLDLQWYLGPGIVAPDFPAPDAFGINLPTAWQTTLGEDTVVGVIDTGILPMHPDLADAVVSQYDFISDPCSANDGDGRDPDASDPGDWNTGDECGRGFDPADSSWHGSSIAGVIAARTDDRYGIAGVAPQAQLVIARALGKTGGAGSDLIDAIYWASGARRDADPDWPAPPVPISVLNMSLGGAGSCALYEQEAINFALSRGIVVVVAAGNDAREAEYESPASCLGVLTVAATDTDGFRTSYSNFGRAVGIAAPGGNFTGLSCEGPLDGCYPYSGILSLSGGGDTAPEDPAWQWSVGTSLSAPLVAGVAALVRSVAPGLTPGEVIDLLQRSSREFPPHFDDSGCASLYCGAGIVDASAAVRAALGEPLPPPRPTPSPPSLLPEGQLDFTCNRLGEIINDASLGISDDLIPLVEGLQYGSAGSLGNLLCFVGDERCPCLRELTDDETSRHREFNRRFRQIVAACWNTPTGSRNATGIAQEAALEICG